MDAQSCEENVLADEIPIRDWFYVSLKEMTSQGMKGPAQVTFRSTVSTAMRSRGLPSRVSPAILTATMGSTGCRTPCWDHASTRHRLEGGGSTCDRSSGWLPDLGADENPWIYSTMQWRIHATVLRASVEVVTCLSGGPKGEGVDADMQVHEGCDGGVIEMSRESDGRRQEFAICEEYPLVLRFEGEEDIRAETMDLPVACGSPTPNESPVAENFDPSDCAGVANTPGDRAMFSEGPETCDDAGTTHIVVKTHQNASATHKLDVRCFKPSLAVGTYKKGQKAIEGVYGGGGPTLFDHPSSFSSVVG
jgi:hypothetical protein